MIGKSCFFIGHRTAPQNILPELKKVVLQHVTDYGVTEFIVGHYGHFDHHAASAVLSAKELYPNITLTLLLPYHPAEQRIDLPTGFDSSFYPPGLEKTPRRYAIVKANQYMVKHVDYLIAYVWHPASNAQNLLEFAEKQQEKTMLHITNIPHH